MAGDININLTPFFKQLQPIVLQEIKQSLQDQSKLQEIQSYKSQLMQLVVTLNQFQAKAENYFEKNSHVKAYQSMLKNSTLGQLAIEQRAKMVLNMEMTEAVQRLFVLEHQIMAFLSKTSATTEYRVFYSDPSHQEKVLEKSIRAEDLYKMNLVSTTVGGKLTGLDLNIKQVLNAQAKALTLSQQDIQKINSLAKEAIDNMITRLTELEELATKTHLGGTNWRRLQELRVLLSDGEDYKGRKLSPMDIDNISMDKIERILAYYTENKSLNIAANVRTLGKNGRVYVRKKQRMIRTSQNRGHLYEALIRMRRDSSLSAPEALERSLGHDIWWAQGDVGNTQVKTLLGNNRYGDRSVGVASINSIFDLANYLLTILENFEQVSKEIEQYLEKDVNASFNSISYEKYNRYASEEAARKVEECIAPLRR